MGVKMNHIYLAGPFFNEEQLNNIKEIENLCKITKHKYFSPRLELILKPNATLKERENVFKSNIQNIQNSKLVLACIDDNDTGTIWEIGYAYAINKPTVLYTFKNKKVNVMLAQSCKGFIDGYKNIELFLNGKILQYQEINESSTHNWVDEFNWEVARKWTQKIY